MMLICPREGEREGRRVGQAVTQTATEFEESARQAYAWGVLKLNSPVRGTLHLAGMDLPMQHSQHPAMVSHRLGATVGDCGLIANAVVDPELSNCSFLARRRSERHISQLLHYFQGCIIIHWCMCHNLFIQSFSNEHFCCSPVLSQQKQCSMNNLKLYHLAHMGNSTNWAPGEADLDMEINM